MYDSLIEDEQRGRLYGAVFSGDRIDVISQATLQIMTSVTVGSQPLSIDMSPDHKELAVAVYNPPEIVFVDLNSLTVAARITTASPQGAVRYGRPGRLYSIPGPYSSYFPYVLQQIHVYDTVALAEIAHSSRFIEGGTQLLISQDNDFLFVPETENSPTVIERYDVTSDNPTFERFDFVYPGSVYGISMLPDHQRIFTASGQVIAGDLSATLASYPAEGYQTTYAPARGQIYVSGPNQIYEINASDYLVVRSFVPDGTPGVMCVSSDGKLLYVSVPYGIQLIQLDPAPVITPTTGIGYTHLVFDPSRHRLYGSDSVDNRIDVISTWSGQVVQQVDLGSEPDGIDLSPDDSTLAVALPASGQIAIVDLRTLTVTSRLGSPNGPDASSPQIVRFGRPGRLYSIGEPYGLTGSDHVHVFDTSTGAEVAHGAEDILGAAALALTADRDTLYVSSTPGGHAFYRYDVTDDLPRLTATATTSGAQTATTGSIAILPDGSRLFTADGDIWSGDLSGQVGQLALSRRNIEYSESNDRLYLSGTNNGQNNAEIDEVDPSSGALLRTFTAPAAVSSTSAMPSQGVVYASTYSGIVSWFLDPPVTRLLLPRATSDYEPPYFDDFSDPSSGWPTTVDNLATRGYVSGEYYIGVLQPGYIVYAGNNLAAGDLEVSVDARTDTPNSGSYGIYFGSTSAGRYVFDVSPSDQTFQLLRHDDVSNTWVSVNGQQSTTVIHAGTASNHLEVVRHGANISLLVNGQRIAQIVDGIFGPGNVGLEAAALNGNHSAYFDNFRLAYSTLY